MPQEPISGETEAQAASQDAPEQEIRPQAVPGSRGKRARTAFGIGSAALVAALLYANRKKTDRR